MAGKAQNADGTLRVQIVSRVALQKRRTSSTTSALDDVLAEAAVLQLLRHPLVCPLVELIDDPAAPRLYLVLPFLSGGPVQPGGADSGGVAAPLSPAVAARCCRDAATALAYCHSRGLAHGDVKPDNLLLDGTGRTVLCDFSVARPCAPPRGGGTPHALHPGSTLLGACGDAAGSSSSSSSAVPPPAPPSSTRSPGTPAFTPPECCAGGPFDAAAADVWALGVTLVALLGGAPPWVEPTPLATYERIAAAAAAAAASRRASPDVSAFLPKSLIWSEPGALRLLDKLLCVDPERRATAAEVVDDPWLRKHAPG